MTLFDSINTPLVGTNLIEASAGTGKTYTICNLVLRLLLENEIPIEQILVVTFTNAATEELRERIRSKIKSLLDSLESQKHSDDLFLQRLALRYQKQSEVLLLLKQALQSFDQAAIFTIHGFCQKVLKEFPLETGARFETELIGDQDELIAQIVDDYWRMTIYPAEPSFVHFVLNHFKSAVSLLPLVYKYIRRPFIHLTHSLEEQPSDQPIQYHAALEVFKQALKDSAAIFHLHRDELHALLSSHPGLNRNKYRLKSVDIWFTQMDICLSSPEAMMNFIAEANYFLKFTNEYLSSSLKKGFDEAPQHPFFDGCDHLQQCFDALHALYDLALSQWLIKLLDYVKVELVSRKRASGVHSYDDLLMAVYNALDGAGQGELSQAIRDNYRAALIDEFQDTDPLQYEIFKRSFYQQTPLFFIGDPKQSIYEFRGADIFAYLRAQQEADQIFTLDINWRSSAPLVQALNTLFTHHQSHPFLYEKIQYHPITSHQEPAIIAPLLNEAPLQVWFIPRDDRAVLRKDGSLTKAPAHERIANSVANEIVHLLNQANKQLLLIDGRALTISDITILVRSHQEGQLMQSALRQKGIPGVIFSQQNLFHSLVIPHFETVLQAIIHWRDPVYLKLALVSPFMNFRGDDIYELMEDENQWAEIVSRFQSYQVLWQEQGFMSMFQNWVIQEGVPQNLLAYVDGQRLLTDLNHLSEVLHTHSVHHQFQPLELLKWLVNERQNPSHDEYLLRIESEEAAAKIYTIHKSKGLEFPIVFCPFLSAAPNPGKYFTFHDKQNDFKLTMDLGSHSEEQHQLMAREEILAENIRLTYVALTRAKYRCYIAWGAFSNALSTPLGYLFHNELSISNDQFMLKELNALVEASNQTIHVTKLPEDDLDLNTHFSHQEITPTVETFEGRIERSWTLSSYSALVSDKSSDMYKDDEDISEMVPHLSSKPILLNQSVYPRGARVGNCLHQILEEIDFQSFDEREMEPILRLHGLDSRLAPLTYQALTHVVQAQLPAGPRLQQITRPQRLDELAFYFPVHSLSVKKLANIFSRHETTQPHSLALEKLKFTPRKGLFTGFIDLVFEFSGRYYVVDYKSNYLGDSLEDYQVEALKQSVQDSYYFLQYYLYTTALHQYMQLRLPNYDYHQHMGGVYYLYLRGMHSQYCEYGVFYDLPSFEIVDALSQYFKGVSI